MKNSSYYFRSINFLFSFLHFSHNHILCAIHSFRTPFNVERSNLILPLRSNRPNDSQNGFWSTHKYCFAIKGDIVALLKGKKNFLKELFIKILWPKTYVKTEPRNWNPSKYYITFILFVLKFPFKQQFLNRASVKGALVYVLEWMLI